MKNLPILEKWFMVELNNVHFVGNVFNHPSFFKNSQIQTDAFVDIDVKNRILYTTTGNFLLGEPDKVFIQKFQ